MLTMKPNRVLIVLLPASWALFLGTISLACVAHAEESYQELLKEWRKDSEQAKRMGTEEGTICNPVLKPVENLVVPDPQPVVVFPDPKIADGCELYRIPEPTAAPPDKIEQEGGPDTLEYGRRTVTWFPRKQQDIVQIPEGVKLLAWTLADGTKFKACYLKTTGLAYPDNDWTPRKGPNIELVMEDGTSRAFGAEDFAREDCDYIRAIHYRELMARRKAVAEYEKEKGLKYEPAEENHGRRRGEAGLTWVDTPHWSFTSGLWNQTKPHWGGSPKNWIWSEKYRQWNYSFFEDVWCWLHCQDFKMPWEVDEKQWTFKVRLNGTGVPGWEGWAAAGRDCYQIHPGAMRPGWFPNAIVHEFDHSTGGWQGAVFQGGGTGWPTYGEAAANYTAKQFEPRENPALTTQVVTAHRDLLAHAGHYGAWTFTDHATANPNFGPMFGKHIWYLARPGEISPYMVIMRMGQDKGLWKNGVKGFGDFIGEMAARYVNYEYKYQKFSQADRFLYPHAPTLLQPVADRPGWYAPLMCMGPGQYGYHIVPLVADPGAKEVIVDLQGLFEGRKHSDWRATIVAVSAENEARYSRTFNKGKESLTIQPGERLYLAVAATPMGYTAFNGFDPPYKNPLFPYEVSFQGCKPIAKRDCSGVTRLYPHRDRFGPDPETAEGKKEIERLTKNIAEADRILSEVDELANKPMFDSAFLNLYRGNRPKLRDEYRRRLANAKGHRHPNGGGWVSESARVDETAFVGPNAYVLDRAKVTGNARITGNAMVIDSAEIGDNAHVGDFGVVGHSVKVGGNAHVLDYSSILRSGDNDIKGNAVIRGESDLAAHWEGKGKGFGADGCAVFDLNTWIRGDHVYSDGRFAGKAEDIPADAKQGNKYMYANWEFKYPSQALLYDSFFNTTGKLRGEPAFVKDGERTIASFDGESQYAAVPWHVSSWPALTVDIMLRHTGGAEQRVFDFGTDQRHVYTTPKDAEGKLALVQVVDGKEKKITAPAIPANQWVRLRAEFSGGEARLYADGKLLGSAKDWLMPRDLDPADQQAANFIAAGRGGKAHFQGDLDFARVYTKVHEDFATVGDNPVGEFKDMETAILGPREFFTTVQQWTKKDDTVENKQ